MEKRKRRTNTAAWWTFTQGKGREGQRMAIGQWAPPAADENTRPWLLAKTPPHPGGAGAFDLCSMSHAADDHDVASSHMQKAILYSLPTDLLRRTPRAVFRLLTGFSFPLVNCMCLLC